MTERPLLVGRAAVGTAVAVLVVLGTVVRLWLLAHDPIDADQAVVGLMAQAINHGHRPAFFWGQDYGGAEPYVVAAGVAVLGLHAWVVNGTASVLSAVAALVAWRLGRAVTGSDGAGAVAGALVWAWSEVDVWNATRETGFREVELVCVLTVFLATARLQRQERPWLAWPLLGLALGLGWWASPEILYAAIPAAPAVAVAASRAVRRGASRPTGRGAGAPMAAGVLAAVLAAAPWLVATIHDHGATLRLFGLDQSSGHGYGGRLGSFFIHSLPMLLGARLAVSGAWLGGRAIGLLVLGVTLLVAAVGLVAAAVRVPLARPLVAAVAAFPFLEAAAGPTFFWQDGRYGMFWPPMVVVAAVAGWQQLLGSPTARANARRSVAGVVACALAAASTAAGLDAATAVPGHSGTTGFAAAPLQLTGHPDAVADEAVQVLAAHHLTAVYASYWVAYVLDVVGGGRVLATPAGRPRSAALATTVASAPRQAWLFVGPTQADAATCGAIFQNPNPQPLGLSATTFEATLTDAGLRYRVQPVGPMVAVVPVAAVSPAWVEAHRPAS